ncbi:hypothetical protein PYH37_005219 [Sinorhizobium numidicum]|uniref:Uncharacterized protein n=1 Tax=Sinorhizobium numidicum TaxID=680248 RepID=A0ABY8D1F7_9HYPH|nr:hypothetical protein [Sinorhizobium numidicum]WEX76868.1 hypothetical protein PYH37_005219 [Sinorhizobium numidicum]WEX83528.1 hypothetical protein PYH38_002312 [Sinorhizobium numidicum]
MRTFEDEITNLIAVDFAVLKPFQRRAIAGLDQYGRTIEVRGIEDMATKIAASFAPFAIWDGDQVLRYPAMTPLITQTLHAIPIELRREACARDRLKASAARDRIARLISSALLGRYRFEPLSRTSAACYIDWEAAFEAQFGSDGKKVVGD